VQKVRCHSNFEREKLGTVLKAAGFAPFNIAKWDEMKAAVILYASENNLKQEGVGEAETA
jgi:hypothetical protein